MQKGHNPIRLVQYLQAGCDILTTRERMGGAYQQELNSVEIEWICRNQSEHKLIGLRGGVFHAWCWI
jgi:hypothetical protein